MNIRNVFLLASAIVFFAAGGVSKLSAQINFSGLLDSSVFLRAGAGDAQAFSYGFEKYANMRMTARMREVGTIFADVNLIALAGDPAVAAAAMGMPFASGPNFIAGFDLERLFFRLNTDNTRLDGGLMRIPIGYGLVWRPTDFLNPPNPLVANARPRGVLGAEFSWWPTFDMKFVGFAATPRDPFSRWGGGTRVGVTLEREWDRIVVKGIYAFELPRGGPGSSFPADPDLHPLIPSAEFGVHRVGLSVKADMELGFALDVLYSYNHEQQTRLDGLAVSAGFDYSFFGGSLLVVAEYLFSGAASSTAIEGGGHLGNRHYLYTGFTWIFNDFTNAGVALISGFSDLSFTPIATFNREIFQGATLALTAQVPLDRDLLFGDGNRGEFGPLPPGRNSGRHFDFSAMLRLRF